MLLLSIPCCCDTEKKGFKVMQSISRFFPKPSKGSLLISIVGAGGKTTLMMSLAKYYALMGLRVLITTTTHIFIPEAKDVDYCIVLDEYNRHQLKGVKGKIFCASYGMQEDKLKGISPQWVDDLFSSDAFDVVLVEADGSKRKPIKAPAEHEPVIPSLSTHVVGIIGMDAWGQPATEIYVHRLNHFLAITGLKEGQVISSEAYEKLIKHPMGLFKGVPVNSEKILFLNKADFSKRTQEAEEILHKISSDAVDQIKRGFWK